MWSVDYILGSMEARACECRRCAILLVPVYPIVALLLYVPDVIEWMVSEYKFRRGLGEASFRGAAWRTLRGVMAQIARANLGGFRLVWSAATDRWS